MSSRETEQSAVDAAARAQVVLGGPELEATVAFFERLGFRMLMITPADGPTVAELEGFGMALRLDTEATTGPGRLRLLVDEVPESPQLTAPNGTVVELVLAGSSLKLPALLPSFVMSRAVDASWNIGRAGMAYRDLIPDRQGGRFIASHIHLAEGGPVPDYVHHHHVRFQMIYCYRGWARLVYEDQGPPFRFEAGDCVLQPPHIRHRVLETSAQFDVVEIGCPARHDTRRDHDLTLPTSAQQPDRNFDGQRFVHHRVAEAQWEPWRFDGFAARDIGISAATDALAGVRVVRPEGQGPDGRGAVPDHMHDGELVFWFVLQGEATLRRDGQDHSLGPADSAVLPAGGVHGLNDCSAEFELLEVTLPAEPPVVLAGAQDPQ